MTVLLLVSCWGGANVWAGNLPKQFQLLPLPQKVEILKGKGINVHELSFVVAEDTATIPILGKLSDALPRVKRQEKESFFLCPGRIHRNLLKDMY